MSRSLVKIKACDCCLMLDTEASANSVSRWTNRRTNTCGGVAVRGYTIGNRTGLKVHELCELCAKYIGAIVNDLRIAV
jgi:hypothetical protein